MFSSKKLSAFAEAKRQAALQKSKSESKKRVTEDTTQSNRRHKAKTPRLSNSFQTAEEHKKKNKKKQPVTPYVVKGGARRLSVPQTLRKRPDKEEAVKVTLPSPLAVAQNAVSPRRLADRQLLLPPPFIVNGQNGVDHSSEDDSDLEVVNVEHAAASINGVSRKRGNNLHSTSTPNDQPRRQHVTPGTVFVDDEDDDSGTTKSRRKQNRAKVCEQEKFKRPAPISPQVRNIDPTPTNSQQVVKAMIVNPEPHFMFDSLAEGRKCFEWLIHPVKPERFLKDLWEQKPLLVKRHNDTYFKDLFSTEVLDQILRERALWFGKNIDLTTYTNNRRETHNPAGRAHPTVVWDQFQNGCSVRLLNPQTFCRAVWKLNSTLQEYFGSFVGANVYLTPAGSQGFAPHYDDIEAFVLQLEGKKKWRLYNPRSANEVLPRVSSENFTDQDIGQAILDVELEAGDLLYFPRGTIHQACTGPDHHSLHMTVSTCQKNTWGDLMELLVPQALSSAIENDVEFRESLPRDYMSYTGIAHMESKSREKQLFLAKIGRLFDKLVGNCQLDGGADQMAKKFIHDSLPPPLTKREKLRSIHGAGETWSSEGGGGVRDAVELCPDTRVKLIRAYCVRLVMEEEEVRLYYSTDNSREYHQEAPQFVVVTSEMAPGIEYLILAYPEFSALHELPLSSLELQMEVGNVLYERGLIMTEDVIDPEEF